MAPPASQPSQNHGPRRRCIAIVLLILFAFLGLFLFFIWVAIGPKRLIYTVKTTSVENFTLSKNHLIATLDFVIITYNPDSMVAIYYDRMEVYVAYDDQTLAFQMVQPFFQPHRNETQLNASLSTQYVTLPDQVSKDLALEKISGKIGLDIWINAKIRFKVGLWKSPHRTFRVSCSPVTVQISKTKSFNRSHCSVKR